MIGQFNEETDALAMLRSKIWHREILQLEDAGSLSPDANLPLPLAIRAEFESIVSLFETHKDEIGTLRESVKELKEELHSTSRLITEQNSQILALLQGRPVRFSYIHLISLIRF